LLVSWLFKNKSHGLSNNMLSFLCELASIALIEGAQREVPERKNTHLQYKYTYPQDNLNVWVCLRSWNH
jgi:hypothetical protein